MNLQTRAKRIDSEVIVSQRLKRMPSIKLKLELHEHMDLSQMQDIGGCRAVLRDIKSVLALRRLYEESDQKGRKGRAQLLKTYDYIEHPKATGYRSIHFVMKHESASGSKHSIYNGLRIEIQIRSRLQHAWATAVETAGSFTGQALKSNLGDEVWKRFFALMGTVIAKIEKAPVVPGTPPDQNELVNELRDLAQRLRVSSVLSGWTHALQITTERYETARGDVFLLKLNTKNNVLEVETFSAQQIEIANERYLEAEQVAVSDEDQQIVLVQTDSLESLRAAFPNFYVDTRVFLGLVRDAIE